MKSIACCDGIKRRDFVQAGVLGTVGLTLPGYLRQLQSADAKAPAAKSAIVIWLGGGPPHLDTFDMKPEAPDDIRGEFQAIPTNVGVSICEHLPHLAKCADKYAVLRGVSHTLAGHELGTNYLSTGNRPVPSLVYPGYGAVVSKELPGDQRLPHFVAIPKTPQSAGYLGVRHAPLNTNDTPRLDRPFSVRGIFLEDGLTVEQYESRTQLLNRVDSAFSELRSKSSLVDGLDQFAARRMRSSALQRQGMPSTPTANRQRSPGNLALMALGKVASWPCG